MTTCTTLLRGVFAALVLAIVAVPGTSLALEDKLVIVTSFPKDLTSKFKAEFEKRHPSVKVEIRRRFDRASMCLYLRLAELPIRRTRRESLPTNRRIWLA